MADADNTLILDTTKGKVTIEMRPDLAPGHVARIKELVRQKFYDGVVFHRVIDGFMAQTGCPQGTGTGGSGKKLKAEFNREPHVRGAAQRAEHARKKYWRGGKAVPIGEHAGRDVTSGVRTFDHDGAHPRRLPIPALLTRA